MKNARATAPSPAALPGDWEQHQDEWGRAYFYSPALQQSRWTLPGDDEPPAVGNPLRGDDGRPSEFDLDDHYGGDDEVAGGAIGASQRTVLREHRTQCEHDCADEAHYWHREL